MPRQARGERRRREILAATLGLITERGVDAVTHRNVAGAAAVPMSSISYYFANRDELLRETLTYFAERETKALEEHSRRFAGLSSREWVDSFSQLVKLELGRRRKRSYGQYVLLLEAARRPELAQVARRWTESYVKLYRDFFESAGSAQPELDARMFVAMIDGFFVEELAAPTDSFVERILKPALDRFFSKPASSGKHDEPARAPS